MAMTDQQFDTYVSECLSLVTSSASTLQSEYGLGNFERWDLDQPSAKLSFSNAGSVKCVCEVAAIGSHGGGYWKWAWANSSIVPNLSALSEAMKSLREKTGIEIFALEAFEADEQMAWEMSGMALHELGGLGVYKGPGESSDLYLLIRSIEVR